MKIGAFIVQISVGYNISNYFQIVMFFMGRIRYSGRALEIYNTLNAIVLKNLGVSPNKVNKNKDLKLFFEASVKPNINFTKTVLYDTNTVRFVDSVLNGHYRALKGSASRFIADLTDKESLDPQEIFKKALEISYGAVNSPLTSHFFWNSLYGSSSVYFRSFKSESHE